MATELTAETIDAINTALFAGQWIEAIKIYRTATGTDLKGSKDFIEALEARLRAEAPERFKLPPGKKSEAAAAGCVAVLLLVVAAVAALVLLLR